MAEVPVGAPIKTVGGKTFEVRSALAITDDCGRKVNMAATGISHRRAWST